MKALIKLDARQAAAQTASRPEIYSLANILARCKYCQVAKLVKKSVLENSIMLQIVETYCCAFDVIKVSPLRVFKGARNIGIR